MKRMKNGMMAVPYEIIPEIGMLQAVLEQVSDLVYIMEVKGSSFVYTYMNRAAETYHKVERESLYGRRIADLLGEGPAVDIEEKYRHVAGQDQVLTYQDVVLVGGEIFHGQSVLTPLVNGEGEVTHVMGITKDDTEIMQKEERLLDASATYYSLLRNTPDAVLITSVAGEIIDANSAFEQLYGYAKEELSEKDYKFVPDARKREPVHLLNEAAAGKTVSGFETVRRHKNGNEIDVSITMAPIFDHREEITAVSFMIRDISDRVETAKRIIQSEEKFQVIADHSDDLITVFNERAEVMYSSPSHKEWLGYDVEGWKAEQIASYIHPDDRKMAIRLFGRARQFEDSFQFRIRLLMRTGLWRWFECRGYPVPSGKFKAHFVLISRDVTTEVDYVEKLKEYAFFDHLTDLPNRRMFEQGLISSVQESNSSGRPFAILYMDGDGFKKINDRHGHDIGDRFLRQVGLRLKKITRDRDAVGRIGGDEFVLAIKDLQTEEEAIGVAERIQEKMNAPYTIGDIRIVSSFSIGIAFYPKHAQSVEDLLKKADCALYESKKQGPGLIVFAT